MKNDSLHSTSDEYVLGTHDAELERLGVQHRLWSAQAFALWEAAGLGVGQTVLDVGSGPGYTSLDLAGVVTPRGKVIAIDESAHFIAHLKKRCEQLELFHLEARVADVQKIDLPAASIDAAYNRWVLCFVPNPEAVIAGVARVLRPNGLFVIQEYMNYGEMLLAPESAAFRRGIEAVVQAWRKRGGDPNVGLRLPSLLVQNGFKLEAIRPLHRVARPGTPFWYWPTIFFRNFLPKLVQQGELHKEEYEAFIRDWETRSHDSAAYYCSPPMIEIIARRE